MRDTVGHNRGIVALSLFSAGVLGIVAAFQTGFIKRLPSLKKFGFDAEKVHASPEAYALFGIPDALPGMVNYAATATLAEFNAPTALAAKAALDVAAVAVFGIWGWRKLHACSAYSLAVGTASIASLVLALRHKYKSS